MSDLPPDQKLVQGGQQIEYDYYKYFGLISLLVLSGVITLAASKVADLVPAWFIVCAAILAILSASLSFCCQTEIVRLATGRQAKPRWSTYGMTVLAVLFAVGMVMFLYVAVALA